MDCFFAAIEMRDFPALAQKPIAVGGLSERRGVISTCNYMARQYGVRSAMPTAIALKKCPSLILQPGRMEVYRQESQSIQDIFHEYTDCIEPLSLDEAFLDVTHASHCHGSATWMAEEIRAKIWEQRNLTASAGIAPNKSLAKIASDWHKPNGQKVILPEEVVSFMQTLPVRKLFGVGPKMEEKLQKRGIRLCSDLQSFTREFLQAEYGKMGLRLYELCRGIDERPVNPSRVRKSLSVEETYPEDLPDIDACLRVFPELFQRLQNRLHRRQGHNQITRVFVKVKFHSFEQTTVEQSSNRLNAAVFIQLLKEGVARYNLSIRLLGLGVRFHSDATPPSQQLPLDLE